MLAATIALVDDDDLVDRRRTARVRLKRSAVRVAPGRARNVLVEDLSRAGFRYLSAERLAVGTAVRVGLAGVGTAGARVVRRDGDEHGCAFDVPLDAAQLAAALVRSTSALPEYSEDIAPGDKWPRSLRAAIFIGGGAATWAAVVALVKALR